MRNKTPLQEKTPFAIDAKPMEGLMTAQAGRGIVRAIAGRSKQPQTRATVDQDATIIESFKREAQWTYEPRKGSWSTDKRRYIGIGFNL